MKYIIVPIPGDRNCVFGPKLCNLMKRSCEAKNVVSQHGIDTESGSRIIQQLQEMIVSE